MTVFTLYIIFALLTVHSSVLASVSQIEICKCEQSTCNVTFSQNSDLSCSHVEPIRIVNIQNSTISELTSEYFNQFGNSIEKLHAENSTIRALGPQVFKDQKNLEMIELPNCLLSSLSENFTIPEHVWKVDFSGNRLETIPNSWLNYISNSKRLQYLDLSGNRWNCTSLLYPLVKLSQRPSPDDNILRNQNKLLCDGPAGMANKSLLMVVELMHLAGSEWCPKKCSCSLSYISDTSLRDVTKKMMVDCSNRQLESLPVLLKDQMKNISRVDVHLDISGNQLKNLTGLEKIIGYVVELNVSLDLNVSRNQISTISDRDANLLKSPQRSLQVDFRNNKIQQIPVHIFVSVLQASTDKSFMFSGNPWLCDCIFAPKFQTLISKYFQAFNDRDNIRCAKTTYEESLSGVVITNIIFSMCDSNHHHLLPLEKWCIALGIITFLVLLMFLYDCYMYKRYNKLPLVYRVPHHIEPFFQEAENGKYRRLPKKLLYMYNRRSPTN